VKDLLAMREGYGKASLDLLQTSISLQNNPTKG